MPKSNSARIAETQRQRQTISKKSEKYAPSTVYLQVLGSGARGAPNTLYMFTDQKRYLFNCGECTQRLAHEHKVKLSRLDDIFITSKTWRNIGGLPGLSLTLQDVGVPNITLHGPKGLDELYHATRRFVIMKDMNVTMAECSPTEDFEDNVMSVKYILLGPQEDIPLKDNPPCKKVKLEDTSGKELEEFNEFICDDTDYYTAKTRSNPDYKGRIPIKSTKAERRSPERAVDLMTKKTENVFQDMQKTSTCTVAYVCTLKKRLGTLDLEKCVEKGVKPGPMLGQLKAGEDVVLPDGRIVLSKDVKTPDDPGPVFIVLDVPDLSYLRPEEFAAHFDDGTNPPENVPALVVHYSPPEVFHTPAYRSFIKRFGPTTRHLILNGQNSCLGSESVHRTQHRLHLLDPDIFPLLKDVSVPALWNSLPSSPKTESPKKLQGLEELKKKFQNMVNMEGSCKLECCPDVADDGEPLELMAGRTLTMFYLRPRRELDRSAEPKLHIQEYIQETMNMDGFAPSLEQFRRLVDGVRYANSGSQEYPKVVFLGTGSCIPSKTRNTSAIVVEIDEDRSMLLDCGEGTFGQLVRFYGPKRVNSFLRTLRAIYISHLHADHHIGLIGVLQARRLAWLEAGREPPAPLYLLAPGQIVTWLSIYDQQFERIRPDFALLPNQSLLIENPTSQSDATSAVLAEMGLRSVSTCLVSHCPNAFGVALQIGEHKITYSGDTLPCEELVKLGMNSSLLIHEATMEDELAAEARVKMHSTTSQAIEQGRRMRARYTVLTHFSQRYARLPRLNANMLNDNTSVGIAFDNMQITMSDLELLPHMYAPLQLMFADHCVEMELKADKRARHRHRANASDDATLGPRRLVSPDCCVAPTSAKPSDARRPRYRDSISSRLRAELKGMKASGGGPSSGSSQSGSTSPDSRHCNSQSRSPVLQRKPPPSPRPDSINDIHIERAMSTRSSSRTSVNRYSDPRAPSNNSSSHTVHSYRVDSTLSKTLSGIDDEVYTRNASGSTPSSYGKPLLTPGTASSSNMSNLIKILRNRPQTSPPCQTSQLIARVRKKSPIIRGNRNAENRMPATQPSSNKREMNMSKLPIPVHLKSPTVSRESTVAKGANNGASYTKIKATAGQRKKGRSPSVESNRSQRTSSQSSKFSYMDTRSDSSATQPENKIERQFFQRQCAENKRKLLTAFQNQYDSTINHLTLSKEVKPFPVYSRPNLAFKPQLEDIKSSILMLNKNLHYAAEQNDHKRPKSVNEIERQKQLNEVKKKFQSQAFFNESKYEKIEGLNWVSWK